MASLKYKDLLISALDVWIASAYAYRINTQTYIPASGDWPKTAPGHKISNNKLVRKQLQSNLKDCSARDRSIGLQAMTWCKQTMMMKSLKGNLNDFDTKLVHACTMEEFNYHTDALYWTIIPCQLRPFASERASNDMLTDVEIDRNPIAEVKKRIGLKIIIIKEFYSQNWGTWYYTAITSTNHMVRFPNKQQYSIGSHHSVQATIAEYIDKEYITKLNRVTFN